MLNGRIYNFTLKKFKIKCLLILQKKNNNNNNKMPISNYHNYHNSYFEKKNSYYIKILCAFHRLPISFSNFQGNFNRN